MLRRRPRKRITKKAIVRALLSKLRGGRRRRVHRHRRVHRRRCGGRRRYRIRHHRKRHYRRHRGRGIFSGINDWLKKTKVISAVGKHLAPFAPFGLSGVASAAADYADKAGYGRRHRKGHRRFGRGFPYPYQLAGGSRLLF